MDIPLKLPSTWLSEMAGSNYFEGLRAHSIKQQLLFNRGTSPYREFS
jgi:hypothetical protein